MPNVAWNGFKMTQTVKTWWDPAVTRTCFASPLTLRNSAGNHCPPPIQWESFDWPLQTWRWAERGWVLGYFLFSICLKPPPCTLPKNGCCALISVVSPLVFFPLNHWLYFPAWERFVRRLVVRTPYGRDSRIEQCVMQLGGARGSFFLAFFCENYSKNKPIFHQRVCWNWVVHPLSDTTHKMDSFIFSELVYSHHAAQYLYIFILFTTSSLQISFVWRLPSNSHQEVVQPICQQSD